MSARHLGDLGHWLLTGDERGTLHLSLGAGWSAVRPQILLAVALVLVNATVLVAFTLPAWRSSSEVGSAVRRGTEAQQELVPALTRASRSYGKVLEARERLQSLRERVADRSGSVSEVVSTLRAAVDAAGLDTERIHYQPQPVPELGLVQIQIELPVRGSYRQLSRFLRALLEGPGFLVLERVAVSSESSADNQGLRVSLRTSVFLDAPDAENLPAAAEPTPTPVPSQGDPVALARQLRERLAALPVNPLEPDDYQLDLSRLDQETVVAPTAQRNPFVFVTRPAGSAAETAAANEPPTVFVPAEPVMPYKLLGITRTDDALLATLSDGNRVHLLHEGDALPEGYRVVSIDLVSVRLDAGDEVVRLSLRRQDQTERASDGQAAKKRQRKKSRGSR